jgi:hypothetical protein
MGPGSSFFGRGFNVIHDLQKAMVYVDVSYFFWLRCAQVDVVYVRAGRNIWRGQGHTGGPTNFSQQNASFKAHSMQVRDNGLLIATKPMRNSTAQNRNFYLRLAFIYCIENSHTQLLKSITR